MTWYDVSTTSEPITPGDVVCLDAKGLGEVVKATSSALKQVGVPLGIALSAAEKGAAVQVADRGAVSKVVTHLSADQPGWVGVGEDARCVRTTAPPSGPLLGMVLANGSLMLSPLPNATLRRALMGITEDGSFFVTPGQLAALDVRVGALDKEAGRSSIRIKSLDERVAKLESAPGKGDDGDVVITKPVIEVQPWRGIQLSGAHSSRARAPTATSLALVGTMTLELWVRPDELVDDKVILGTDHDGEGELLLCVTTANNTRRLGSQRACTLLYKFGDGSTGRQSLRAEVSCTVGEWFHVAVVRETAADKTHRVILYKDGVSVLEQTTPAVRVSSPGYRWALGGNGYAPLAAAFAELRIWSTARSAAQVEAARSQRLSGQEPGLVGYWRLDETGTPTTLRHLMDATLSMEAAEVVSVTEGPGVLVTVESVPALRFDGDTKLLLGRPAAHPWSQSYTLELWVRPSSTMPREAWLCFAYGANRLNVQVGADGTLYGAGTKSAPGVIPLDQWSHVAIVVDHMGEARSAPALIVNGATVAVMSVPAPMMTQVLPMLFGFQPWSNWGKSFVGDVAEIRLWKRALTSHELRALMQRRPSANSSGLVGWWAPTNKAGMVIPDLSAQANHAVLLRRPLITADGPKLIYGETPPSPKLLRGTSPAPAIRLNGQSGALLRVSNHATNRLTGDLTVEAWIRVAADFRYAVLYGKSDTAEGTVYLMADPTERSFRYYGDGNTAAGPNATFCPAELIAGEWYHLAFVRDATRRELRYYINGALAQLDINCLAVSGKTTDGPVSIGTKINGDLCELRVWSIARDEDTIRRDLGKRLPAATGLVARWAMDEGIGTTAKNSTDAGSAIDAALLGGTSWVADGPALE